MKEIISMIVVAGPTASGKSDYAQQLALAQGGEIINADSQQFYQGLDIGTGKVSFKEQKVVHWFLNLLKPGQLMSAMDFAKRADDQIREIRTRGVLPILVGGTGFYLRALLEGLDDLPPRDQEQRLLLEKRLQSEGPESLHQELKKVDPLSAQKIAPQDRSRLVRYLEIYQLTGLAPSSMMRGKRPNHLRYPVQVHWLCPPRDYLRQRIAKRVEHMLASGWVEEVQGFLQAGNPPSSWPVKPIGYRELQDYLEGKAHLDEVAKKIIQKTCQYAKRQETFFKGLFSHQAYTKAGSSLNIFREKSFFDRLLT
ncbi:MAG: tRNA (adenosine(37)-N6)-dimethylallyltransferase MiaA [Deltaproteobacteria bacterium]|nr:tRNA (adenosine(37)-N6)-dimethylallyltransferase MiaA [Deltaproteobacteria bacterium]